MGLLLANGVELTVTRAQVAGNAELKFFDRATDTSKDGRGGKGFHESTFFKQVPRLRGANHGGL